MAVTGAQPQNMSRRAQGEVCGQGGWAGVESGGRAAGAAGGPSQCVPLGLGADPEDREPGLCGVPLAPLTWCIQGRPIQDCGGDVIGTC